MSEEFSQEFIEMMATTQVSVDRIYTEMWRRWAFGYLLAVLAIRHG